MSEIPEFVDGYFLPPGEHKCSLQEIEERFLWTERRRSVWRLFKNFLDRLNFFKITPAVILINGSFVTKREEPGDVDIGLLIPPKDVQEARASLSNAEDWDDLCFILNPRYQAMLRSSFGVHPLVVQDRDTLAIVSDLFRTGGSQFGHLRPPDKMRDPSWLKTPEEKGILRIEQIKGGL